LYGVIGNNPINFFDSVGLKCACKCKTAKIIVGKNIKSNLTPATNNLVQLQIGFPLARSFELDGDDHSKCKCKQKESGIVTANLGSAIPSTNYISTGGPNKDGSYDVPCEADPNNPGSMIDWPGLTTSVAFNPGGGTIPWSINYDNLSITITCTGDGEEGGTASDSVSISGKYSGTVTFDDKKRTVNVTTDPASH
jgi:hypothetical protein